MDSPIKSFAFRGLNQIQFLNWLQLQKQIETGDVDRDVLIVTKVDTQRVPAVGLMVGDELAGFVRYDPGTGHLHNLYVSPSFRGLGLASWALAQIKPKTLHVMPRNHKAIDLYRRCGMEISPERPGPRRFLMVPTTP